MSPQQPPPREAFASRLHTWKVGTFQMIQDYHDDFLKKSMDQSKIDQMDVDRLPSGELPITGDVGALKLNNLLVHTRETEIKTMLNMLDDVKRKLGWDLQDCQRRRCGVTTTTCYKTSTANHYYGDNCICKYCGQFKVRERV